MDFFIAQPGEGTTYRTNQTPSDELIVYPKAFYTYRIEALRRQAFNL